MLHTPYSNALHCTTLYYKTLLSGKNCLKQRYRQLAKEFHPDSGRNVDLPQSTVNSLMSNLTGACCCKDKEDKSERR
jgi:hypothetical protein